MALFIQYLHRIHVRKRQNCEFKQKLCAFSPVQDNLAFNGTASGQIGSKTSLFFQERLSLQCIRKFGGEKK